MYIYIFVEFTTGRSFMLMATYDSVRWRFNDSTSCRKSCGTPCGPLETLSVLPPFWFVRPAAIAAIAAAAGAIFSSSLG